MSELPELTVADVRTWTVDRYYERGERYFRDDRIFNARRHDRTLKALCRGSQPNPYRVNVTLGPDGIEAGSCSCPVGDDGRCKHAVALLLTWVKQPNAFERVDALTQRLDGQSPDTLIDLIERLIEREPTLESLVELYLDSRDDEPNVDVRGYVEQAFAVRGVDPYDQGYARRVAERLDPLLDRGREYLASEEWAPARRLFATVAEIVCERFDALRDEQGHLISVVDACGAGLRDVLSTTDNPAVRSHALETVVDICLWNAEHGGHGAADAAGDALRKHTTPGERRRAAHRLREQLPAPPDDAQEQSEFPSPRRLDPDDQVRETLGPLLLALERNRLDSEAYLDLCRRTGQWRELVDQLLELNRLDAATDAALRHLPDYSLTDVADRLADNGADTKARSLLEHRLDENRPYPPLLRWLYEHALDAKDHETALSDARRLFRAQPSVETYEHVRRAATSLDKWPVVREDLLTTLSQSRRQDLLERLYVHEQRLDTALEIVEPFAGEERSLTFDTDFLVSVADVVADTHPEAAVALYEECARALIAERGRSNYADATNLLRRAKSVYEENDALDAWTDLLDRLHDDELHRLPAARDEFENAGLL